MALKFSHIGLQGIPLVYSALKLYRRCKMMETGDIFVFLVDNLKDQDVPFPIVFPI